MRTLSAYVFPAVAIGSVVGVGICKFFASPCTQARRDKRLRQKLSEQQVDDMIEDSFPASDPPSTY